MIYVIATIDLVPGARDAFLAEFKKNLASVRAEAGCIAYGPAVDADTGIPTQFKTGADRLTVMEQWESVDALKAHAVAPHMKTYRAATREFVVGMELRILSPA